MWLRYWLRWSVLSVQTRRSNKNRVLSVSSLTLSSTHNRSVKVCVSAGRFVQKTFQKRLNIQFWWVSCWWSSCSSHRRRFFFFRILRQNFIYLNKNDYLICLTYCFLVGRPLHTEQVGWHVSVYALILSPFANFSTIKLQAKLHISTFRLQWEAWNWSCQWILGKVVVCASASVYLELTLKETLNAWFVGKVRTSLWLPQNTKTPTASAER